MNRASRPRATVVGLLALVVVSLLGSTRASAHSEPVELEPGHDQTVAKPPRNVSAIFSEELAPGSTLTVRNALGDVIATGRLDLDDVEHRTLVAEVVLDAGRYTSEWEAVSAEDGDETNGSWSFAVGDAGDRADASPERPALSQAAGHSGNAGPGIIPIILWSLTIVLVVTAGVGLIRSRRPGRSVAVE